MTCITDPGAGDCPDGTNSPYKDTTTSKCLATCPVARDYSYNLAC